jgi:hypothetical protein
MTTLDLNGLPIEPAQARKSFKHACRFQIRDNVSITIKDWRLVPEATKEQLWKNIIEKIKYPDGVDEEFVKLDMNTKYVNKQLIPKHMSKITQAQWNLLNRRPSLKP